MILDRAINGPRASMETRTLSQEELGRFLKNLFLTGEDVEPGQRAAERLSPVAAAHRILSNSFGLIPFGTYVKDGDARRAVHDPALDRLLHVRANERIVPEAHHVQRLLARLRGLLEPAGRSWPPGGPHPPAHGVLHHPQGPGERALLVRLQRGRLAAHLLPL